MDTDKKIIRGLPIRIAYVLNYINGHALVL